LRISVCSFKGEVGRGEGRERVSEELFGLGERERRKKEEELAKMIRIEYVFFSYFFFKGW
jgi:hypothetical protein